MFLPSRVVYHIGACSMDLDGAVSDVGGTKGLRAHFESDGI